MEATQESMVHWNDNMLCAIDVETTGDEPDWHELVQVAILPLNSHIEPIQRITPLCLYVMPEHPERLHNDLKGKKWHKKLMQNVMRHGFEREAAKDILQDWFAKLEMQQMAFGTKKIMPLGQNFGFDSSFLKGWLHGEYDDYFMHTARDSQAVALFLNDLAGYHERTIPYNKVGLNSLCNKHNISNEGEHDALIDCIRTAAVYKAFCAIGLF